MEEMLPGSGSAIHHSLRLASSPRKRSRMQLRSALLTLAAFVAPAVRAHSWKACPWHVQAVNGGASLSVAIGLSGK